MSETKKRGSFEPRFFVPECLVERFSREPVFPINGTG